jgi:squalene-associated FAD-dependent desaturase
MTARTIHIIGAGLAGLSAAVRLSGRGETVVIYEPNLIGGRCRSYHDTVIDMVIDNGNHLLLSANHAALDFLRTIGAADRLIGPDHAEFPFVDLANGARWTLRINDGRLPWWIFDTDRRVPGTRSADYLRVAPLLWAAPGKSVGETVDCSGALFERLLGPLLLAALNVEPQQGSAQLAGQVIRETIAAGGRACRPLIAREGLSAAFVDPAVAHLEKHNAQIELGQQVRAIGYDGARVASLDFGQQQVALAPGDAVILAVPPVAAASLVPGLQTPNEFRAIVNAHFRIAPPPRQPPIQGIINGTVEWIFAFPDRLSVTISAADRLLESPREDLVQTIWREVAAVTGLPADMPRWQIVRERRATFASTPAQNARRPGPQTAWANLVLAGDWTATGLPATIESAIRSGYRAADVVTTSR